MAIFLDIEHAFGSGTATELWNILTPYYMREITWMSETWVMIVRPNEHFFFYLIQKCVFFLFVHESR